MSEEVERCEICKHCTHAPLRGDDHGYCTLDLDTYKPPEAGVLVMLSKPHVAPLPLCKGFERR